MKTKSVQFSKQKTEVFHDTYFPQKNQKGSYFCFYTKKTTEFQF